MNLPQILTLYSGEKVPLDPVLEVWEMNYQEVNKVSGESWEGCWLG